MIYKKEEYNHEKLEDILTEEQMDLLERWLKVNKLKYCVYNDDMPDGVAIHAESPEINERWKTEEWWEIEFIRLKGTQGKK